MVRQIDFENVENRILELRGQKILLDTDVALLYGVTTKEINQAVKNNPDKFPEGYVLVLERGEKDEVVKKFDHLKKLKFSPQLPKAFTEKGLYMLATIVRGERATQTTLLIIETYAKLKNFSRNMELLSASDNEIEKNSILQRSGKMIAEVLSDHLPLSESETVLELNFAVVKIKPTLKKKV